MKRRAFVLATSCIAAVSWLPLAQAQDAAFPTKPIRILVPSTSGGGLDAVARLMGERMAKTLRQPVVVENMPGAGTLLAVRHVAKAPADGYTILMTANTIVTLPILDPKAGYSLSDFTGISDLTRSPMVLVVSAASNIKTLAQLVEAAKKAPGSVTFASVGVGTTSHLPVVGFARTANLDLTMVPYKGTPASLPDVIGQRVTFTMGNPPSVGELVNSGKLRALAVSSTTRSADFPDVPTFKELGFAEASYELFYSFLAPAGVPARIRSVLAEATEVAKKDPELQKKLKLQGQEASPLTTPDQLNAFLRQDEARMRKLVKDADIRLE